MSSSIFFSYCNGGTLTRLLSILARERIRCPEVFLLHLVDRLLGVIISLHRGVDGVVPVTHQSVHACNVFLHYPTEESKLPDIFPGDFDGARRIHESVWDASGNSSAGNMRDMKDIKKDDLENKMLAEFGGTDDETPPQDTEEQAKSMIDDLQAVSDSFGVLTPAQAKKTKMEHTNTHQPTRKYRKPSQLRFARQMVVSLKTTTQS
jgi:hypothetical protein